MKRVAVIGAGVIGLTSAICLQNAGYAVTIYTKEMPQDTTSSAAGAVWWGYSEGKAREWAGQSLKVYQELIAAGIESVLLLRLHDFYRFPMAMPWFHRELPYFERIFAAELTPPFVDGFVMDVPLIEAPAYLDYLQGRFQDNGGEIMQQEIGSFSELATDYPIIVNCSGLGSRTLADDSSIYPVRGQTVVVDAPDVIEGYSDDEVFTYIFPRNDGVLLGGVKQPEMLSGEIDIPTREDILARCGAVDTRLSNRSIVKEKVGFRPTRAAVRLESEQLSDDCLLIHNYGHSGTGFTLSWGCAKDVVNLVEDAN